MAREEGFSLLELLVVLMALGIVLMIAMPVYANNAEKAKTRSCQTNLRTMDGAIQSYAAEKRVPPTAIGDLVPGRMRGIPECPVDASHAYSLIGDISNQPVQVRVECADGNGRGGVEDANHWD